MRLLDLRCLVSNPNVNLNSLRMLLLLLVLHAISLH